MITEDKIKEKLTKLVDLQAKKLVDDYTIYRTLGGPDCLEGVAGVRLAEMASGVIELVLGAIAETEKGKFVV